ncbi:hypothetical protein M5K25_009172 [Dendrobium thyrsiflorum]|uniref:Uncharacterized protein n=1 Tax=Dendrobium thyrsiflorum TaxID=117978 RepID=A0ABD0V4S6_DENTH
MKTSPIKIPWFRRPGLSCSLVYLVRGGSRPNLTEGTLSAAMGCFVQEYLVDLGWYLSEFKFDIKFLCIFLLFKNLAKSRNFEENPAAFRRPLPGAGSNFQFSQNLAKSRIFEENPAAFRRPLPGAGSPIGLGGDHARLGLGRGDGGGFDGVGGGSGGWRSAAGLAVGDGLDGGRSSKEAARARRQEFGRRRCRLAAVRPLASSPTSQRRVSSESVRLGHVWLGCWSRSRPATEKQWVALESAGDWQCRSVTDQVAGVDEVGIDLLRPEQLESSLHSVLHAPSVKLFVDLTHHHLENIIPLLNYHRSALPSNMTQMSPHWLTIILQIIDDILKYSPLLLQLATLVWNRFVLGRLQVNDLEVDAPEFGFSFNSSTSSVEDFHFIPGTPSSCLIIFIVFLEITSFVPSFLSSCCSVLKSPYLSPSSEISNAFVLVLTFQQALLLLDHHFDHHPRGLLLLLLIARIELDLLESHVFDVAHHYAPPCRLLRPPWCLLHHRFLVLEFQSDVSNRSLALDVEALASKFLSLSTGIFCQQILEYEVQVSCSNVHHVELILVFLELLWQLVTLFVGFLQSYL